MNGQVKVSTDPEKRNINFHQLLKKLQLLLRKRFTEEICPYTNKTILKACFDASWQARELRTSDF